MRRTPVFVAAALSVLTVAAALGSITAERPAAARPFMQIGLAHADYVPVLDGSQPIFVLFIGSDARPDQGVAGQRTDSIHLVAINPAKHRTSILGFPRDSWVEVPGHGFDKINAAMTYGGPQLTVQTVENLTGIRIDYWVLTAFEGITQMIDDIGGLTIDVPFPMHDSFSRSDFEPGPLHMSGSQVLAFSRDRHSLPQGDFGRSENQGLVFVSTLAQFRKEFRKDPSRVFEYVGAGLRNVVTNVPLDQVMALAFTSTAINAKKAQNMVVPGSTGMEGGLSVVYISPSAQAIYADMKDDGVVSKVNVPPSPNASLTG